ncbi:DUF885 domain-containing protein [Actinocrinis puniceicyclus]|uniref:DUF885 domain-containing protein n=1 Tax=Actinocrinis puniceicyclus TaxID=977794 RepID=A0A8J7WL11_9ACTN|nr:DUF885 domain-containing protein [Actinocrinis puniceicyclus]MBS2961739.1 DUF885 domain-containing protein [Actinocrinis puniceicyclus]
MSDINEIADGYVERAAALNPLEATYCGVPGYDERMSDLSPDGFRARADLDRETINALSHGAARDEGEQVAKDAMLERLGLAVEFYDSGEATSDLNVLASPLQAVRQVFDLMPIEGEQAQRNLAARIAAVPEAYAGLRRTLLESAKSGRVAARRQVLACAKQCAEWAGIAGPQPTSTSQSPEGDDAAGFYAGLVARTGTQGALRAELDQAAQSAREATAQFGVFLETELLPYAPEQDAVGRERYRLASRYFLGAAVDLDDAYAWGWSEVKRIEAEMNRVAGLIVPGGVDEAVAALDTEPRRRIAGREALRDWMQELADRTIAELHGRHFDIPEPARRIECMIAPTNDGGIYYTGPSEDFSRPGRMWWSVPEGVEEFSTWREVSTVYHEGVPGHHLQVAQAVHQRENLNRWRRLMCWVSGHGEGWALYSERLMEELGYLDDPGDLLGMLDMQMLRAARVVVDLGVHLRLPIPAGTGWHEGEIWNPELAWEFLRGHVRMGEEMLRFELNRYLGWPGQAPSYKLGERIWLQAREDAKARKGPAFDLKQFHSQALALGGLGLDPLQAALARM